METAVATVAVECDISREMPPCILLNVALLTYTLSFILLILGQKEEGSKAVPALK